MGRMHRPDNPNTEPGSRDGGPGHSDCPVCGETVNNFHLPDHIASHGDQVPDDA